MNILNQGVSLLDPAAPRPKPSEAGNATAATSAGSVAASKPVAEAKPASGTATPSDDTREINAAITKLNESVQNIQRSIEFSLDEESGRNVVKVVDRETGDVIRQMPTEDALAVSRNIKAFLEARTVAGDSGGGPQPEEALGLIMREQA